MIEQQPTTIDLQPPTTTVVSLTDAAVSKLLELTKEETNPDVGLRVYVYSGGCSGFRYGMMLEDAPTPEDQILDASGIKVYVDGQSISLPPGVADRLRRHAHGRRLHRQQPERGRRLRMRLELPDRRRRGCAEGLLALIDRARGRSPDRHRPT